MHCHSKDVVLIVWKFEKLLQNFLFDIGNGICIRCWVVRIFLSLFNHRLVTWAYKIFISPHIWFGWVNLTKAMFLINQTCLSLSLSLTLSLFGAQLRTKHANHHWRFDWISIDIYSNLDFYFSKWFDSFYTKRSVMMVHITMIMIIISRKNFVQVNREQIKSHLNRSITLWCKAS